MKKIVAIVGARPQFIKHAPVLLALGRYFSVQTIHTGQHYDDNMSRIFFDELKIPKPEFQLTIQGGSHQEQIDHMQTQIDSILKDNLPDFVLVYGDTNSTVSGAMSAHKMGIPVIHIEAGLRSFNKTMPEEMNRIRTDHVSTILFCPSSTAVENLRREQIERNVFVCGDVMKDMLKLAEPFLEEKNGGENYLFATIHRPYNTDDKKRIKAIIEALNNTGKTVVFSIHPRTLAKIKEFGIELDNYSNIRCIDPVGYFDSLSYQKYAFCVITDSGGIQKEAYWLEKKCITVRPETEWVETLHDNCNTLVFEELERLPNLIHTPISGNFNPSLYGNADAALKITNVLKLF